MKKDFDFLPLLSKEDNLKFKCRIKELATEFYRADIDQDPTNAIVYLNIGYDNLTDIDSPIYLDCMDALELGHRLIHYATIAMKKETNGKLTRLFVEELEDHLKNKEISWINVYPINLADKQLFHGACTLDIKYYLKNDKKNKLYHAKILSRDLLKDKIIDRIVNQDFENVLKSTYDINHINFHIDKFKSLFNL